MGICFVRSETDVGLELLERLVVSPREQERVSIQPPRPPGGRATSATRLPSNGFSSLRETSSSIS